MHGRFFFHELWYAFQVDEELAHKINREVLEQCVSSDIQGIDTDVVVKIVECYIQSIKKRLSGTGHEAVFNVAKFEEIKHDFNLCGEIGDSSEAIE